MKQYEVSEEYRTGNETIDQQHARMLDHTQRAYLLFTDENFSTYKYEFSTGLETEIHSTSLPDKESRVIKNNQMYYSYATGKLFILNMADYQQNILELDTLTGQNTGNSGNTQVEPSTMETGSRKRLWWSHYDDPSL